MKKTNVLIKTFSVLLLLLLMFGTSSLHTVDAKKNDFDEKPLFTETITLDNETSKFDVGFIRVDFKKNFIPEEMYPITFEVKVYAENGKAYIEFEPDVEIFFKDVTIHVHAYEGFLYDVALDEYVYVEIPNSVFKVPHFSRWCFFW